MNRRHWFARLFAGLLIPVMSPLARLWGQEAKQEPTFEDRLKSGLLCRRPEEFEFVAQVAEKVRVGALPQDLVLGTMKWAIKKRAKFPFYYFQFALLRQAEALGVELTPAPPPEVR